MGESWADCAAREVKEETNLDMDQWQYFHTTNDPAIAGNPAKHYITIFMTASVSPTSAELINMEPHKCEKWEWIPWSEVLNIYQSNRSILFDPVVHLIEDGKLVQDLFQ